MKSRNTQKEEKVDLVTQGNTRETLVEYVTNLRDTKPLCVREFEGQTKCNKQCKRCKNYENLA